VPLQITPNTLARAYADAGYFARNVRAIEVLIDRDAVTSGTAAASEPWQYYDLGHGYCTYSFFEQCPHRMACAKCDFYTPKDSSRALLLEAKNNLQRMLAAVPSPTTSELPSTTAKPHSTSFSGSSPTRQHRPDPPPASWDTTSPGCRSCQSSPGRPPDFALLATAGSVRFHVDELPDATACFRKMTTLITIQLYRIQGRFC
jgi:hypothetical protein